MASWNPVERIFNTNTVQTGLVCTGVTLVDRGDARPWRVLCTGQTDKTTNGIWLVSRTGWVRAPDASRPEDFENGKTVCAFFPIIFGASDLTLIFTYVSRSSPGIGTSPIEFDDGSLLDDDSSLYLASGVMYFNHIYEKTSGHGVVIDGVTVKDGEALADNTHVFMGDIPSDIVIDGTRMGLGEAVVATVTLPAAKVADRLKVRLKALVGLIGFDGGVPTIQIRIRAGGLTGGVVCDTGALNAAAMGTDAWLEFDGLIDGLGAPGWIGGHERSFTVGATGEINQITWANVDTTADIDFVVTAVSSTAAAANTLNLSMFSVEVRPA